MIDYLNQLEEKITRLSAGYASLKEENVRLSREHAEMKKMTDELDDENHRLRETQGQVKERVDAIIKKIEDLEEK